MENNMENKKLNLYQKIKAISDIVCLEKNGTNPHFKSKYAELNDIISALAEPCNNYGVSYYQIISGNEIITHITDNDSATEIKSNMPLIFTQQDMQKLGSAITYARRYSLQTMFNLRAEDDDGNGAVSKNNSPSKINVQKVLSADDINIIECCATQEELIKVCGDMKKKLGAPYLKSLTAAFNRRQSDILAESAQ